MSFRDATLMDCGWVYLLRIQDEAGCWYTAPETRYDDHVAWFAARLRNPLVRLLVWNDGEGFCRVDSNGELAFHGPPEMLKDLAGSYEGRLKVTVDADDPKVSVLRRAGFETYPAFSFVHRSAA